MKKKNIEGMNIVVKNRQYMFVAIFLLIPTIVLNIVLTHLNYFSGTTGTLMSIPIRTSTGYHYWGVALVTTMVIGLALLIMALKKYRGRVVLLSIVTLVILPPIANMLI